MALTLATIAVTHVVLAQPRGPEQPNAPVDVEYDFISSDSEPLLGQDLPEPVDDQPLWRMLAEKRYGLLRVRIEKFRTQYPDWSPPEKLMTLLTEGERLDAIQQSKATQNWSGLLDLARQHPEEFDCASIHNMWTLGDAYAALGRTRDLVVLYTTVIRTCPRAEDRIVTLQRAMSELPYRWTEALMKREAKNLRESEEEGAFIEFRYTFYSAWLAEAMADGTPAMAERPAKEIADAAAARHDAKTAMLIAWLHFKQNRYPQAAEWFTHGLKWEPRADGAHGLALTYLRLNRTEDAEKLARKWLSREPAMAKILAEILLTRARSAYDAGAYQDSLRLTEESLTYQPESRGASLLNAWSLHQLAQFEEAAAAFERLYRAKPDRESAEGLLHSHLKLSSHSRIVDLANELKGPLHEVINPDANGNEADLRYLFYTSWMNQAAEATELAIARDAGNRIAKLIVKRRDAETAVSLGWVHLKLNDAAQASQWFADALAWQESADAALGRVLAYQQLGKVADAETLARRWADRSPDIRSITADILLTHAGNAYDEGAFEDSLRLTGESLKYRPGSRGTSLLNAWSHYQLGQHLEAADAFEALYREQPDEQSAQGLLASANLLGTPRRVARLAVELGGPLPALWRESRAKWYASKKLFIAAAATDPQAIPRLENIGTPSVAAGGYFRTRSGTKGLAHLDISAAVVEAAATRGRHKASLRLTTLNLNSGTPATSARLGTRDPDVSSRGPQAASPTTSVNGVVEPLLSYRHEGDWMPYLELGLTPLGAEIGPRVFGKLGVEHQHRRGFWRTDLFAEPKRDSILSYTGIVNPVTGQHWGRVIESGVSAEALQLVGNRWSVVAGVAASQLTGSGVADNRRLHLTLSPGYSLSVPGFDYLTLGPAYAYETYDKNLSQFTLGQGGYFSPESFHKGGLALNFLTQEGADFIVRGYVFAGYQNTVEENTPFDPRRPLIGDDFFRGQTLNGVASDADLVGVYRVGRHFQVGASFRYIASPNFNDFTGGLFLRYSFGPRSAVFSSDLQDFIGR